VHAIKAYGQVVNFSAWRRSSSEHWRIAESRLKPSQYTAYTVSVPGWYLTIGHDDFLPHTALFIIHCHYII